MDCILISLLTMFLLLAVLQTLLGDKNEYFAYDSSFIAPGEYDAYGITNPAYIP